jgi:translation initiation factor IF-1
MFRVDLDNKHLVLAVISGKMRKKFVRLTAGDRVKMEMSQYQLLSQLRYRYRCAREFSPPPARAA